MWVASLIGKSFPPLYEPLSLVTVEFPFDLIFQNPMLIVEHAAHKNGGHSPWFSSDLNVADLKRLTLCRHSEQAGSSFVQ
jgi:hypothetical protein